VGHPTEAATADSTALSIAAASGVDRRPEDRTDWTVSHRSAAGSQSGRRRGHVVPDVVATVAFDVHPSAAGSNRAAERSVIAVYAAWR